tara:strand:- start:1515 stop:2645 length:1131 start_codon:yes stop_codon:yes gene_type:complete
MSLYKDLNTAEGMDKITDVTKVTAGYFSDNAGIKTSANLHSGALSDSNEQYYYNVALDSETGSTQFSVAYGHVGGSGSKNDSNSIKGPTQAVYEQWAGLLLAENEVTGGFVISANNGLAAAPSQAVLSGRDSNIYVIALKRSLFKDRLNKKNWTLKLTGHNNDGTTNRNLVLTDDSATSAGVGTPAGRRYNIVSGSQGTVTKAASVKTYGFCYPELGVMVFSGAELSSSIPGDATSVTSSAASGVVTYQTSSAMGFATNNATNTRQNDALRMINCLTSGSGGVTPSFQLRSEEDQTSVSYFCRARAGEFNFSNSPTFVSGSVNEIRHTDMHGNPVVFITGVNLFSADGTMIAQGKLSTPLKKNFSSEATIKVKLTY